ncbi:MAG TPA: holo-ACP synthase [Spirochaetota bacterium]|jgi:holo-[acyl-carrier-protein] synthase|nr:holo-ACP synthase [Spirochaetota bacterium]OQA96471.1 MAG: Holo-(acyl-carrier-protein) synthase [Spirochaetes bacterium ADurb.Bin218]HOK03002.1 holo-ACP synthase [Spirochaetota bacterium]HOK93284.1 holo-ACP synthase [Spirochaetota bacterium]HON16368.1 holo-ACP synthase [Spirochaetota bacterium]
MIVGTGIDLVKIIRIEELFVQYGDRFLKKILSSEEIKNIPSVQKEEYIAGRFAAKEALAKATEHRFNMTEISVLNDSSGKPFFSGKFFENEMAGKKIHLSISHDGDYAVAFVVIEA